MVFGEFASFSAGFFVLLVNLIGAIFPSWLLVTLGHPSACFWFQLLSGVAHPFWVPRLAGGPTLVGYRILSSISCLVIFC